MNNDNEKQPIDSSWGEIVGEAKPIQPQPITHAPHPEGVGVLEVSHPQPNISQPTEEELHQPKTPLWKIILKGIIIFVSVFIFIYLFLTFPAQWQKVKYFFTHLGKNQAQKIEVPVAIDQLTSTDLFLSTMQDALQKVPDKKTADTATSHTLSISDLQDNTLLIPKLDIKAPIIWGSPPDENVMMDNLQKGVVQYQGTGLPNEADGNVFISGHSSYYWWDKGQYKTVFATLDNLTEGDELAMAYQGKIYFYRVYEKLVVKPEDVSVLEPVGKPIVSLMTCVPVGTNLNRLIVRAERIDIAGQNGQSLTPTTTPTPIATITPTPTATPTTAPTEQFIWDIVTWIGD